MEIKFKKIDEDAVLPSCAKEGDAGLDLTATSKVVTDLYIEYGLGLSVEIPEGFVGLVFPRSSISKKDMMLANAVGVIDSGYRGEITARFKYNDYVNSDHYKVGDKVCQLIVLPYPKVVAVWADKLSDSQRGTGSYGSSGN